MLGAQVGSDNFLQVGGEMMRVVAQSEHGCVVEEVLGEQIGSVPLDERHV